MRIIADYVLIKPDSTHKLVLSTGLELYFDPRYEKEKAAPQSGIVMAVPEKLRFTHKVGSPSVKYNVDMELQVGDRVVFNFLAFEQATSSKMVIDEGILVRYDEIYVAIRDEEVICINGTVVVKPDYEKINSILLLPESVKHKKLKVSGEVVYASKEPHREERFNQGINTMACPMVVDENGFRELGRYVQPGDHVQFHFSNAIPLQHYYELHGVVSKNLLYRMKHTDIEIVDKTEVHA
jgi:hypothetical protein